MDARRKRSMKSRYRLTLAAVALAAALAGASGASAQAAQPGGEYIVQFAPTVGSADAREAIVEHVGGSVTRDVPLINAAGAQLTPDEAAALGHRGDVKAVTANG